MKVLFIGGTGNISTACTIRAMEKGFDLYLFNRGKYTSDMPKGATLIKGDINNPEDRQKLVRDYHFDVVVNWICFTPEEMKRDIELFNGKTGQYVFISSASAYQKPPVNYLVTESTPLYNPYWKYSQEKIACEEELINAYRVFDFPYTIVRPSYTYGYNWIPTAFTAKDYNPVHRIRQGKKIISHGDGQSLWVMTHNTDFAKGFVGLLGHQQAIHDSFHITSDEVLTWDQIYQTIGKAIGIEPKLIHIPSDFIHKLYPEAGIELLGDKARSMVLDNTKIKRLVPEFQCTTPFSIGIKKSTEWFEAKPERMKLNEAREEMVDDIVACYEKALSVV